MCLFLDIKIKFLLSRLFCVQIILKCKCNIFITGKIFSHCAEVKGVKYSGDLSWDGMCGKWDCEACLTSVVFIDINLSVYYFRYVSEKSFIWTGFCRTDYLMNCRSREVKIHSDVSECRLWDVFSTAHKCDFELGEVKQIKTGRSLWLDLVNHPESSSGIFLPGLRSCNLWNNTSLIVAVSSYF